MSGPASLFREIHRLRRFLASLQQQLDQTESELKRDLFVICMSCGEGGGT